jgi:hypothetical protein
MRNLKIIQLLNSFSKEEFTEFIYFAESPFYRKERKYTEILSELKKYFTSKKDLKDIPSEKFYDKIFQGKKLNSQTQRNRINELTKIGEKFIAEKELAKDENLRKLLLLKGYKDRKLNKQFISEFNKIMGTISKKSTKSNIVSDILNLKVMFSKEIRKYDDMFSDFNNHIEYLFVYFLENLFESKKEYEIEKMYGVNPSIKILEILTSNINFINLINSIEEQNNPSYLKLIINYYQYKSLANLDDIKSFEKLQKIFNSSINQMSNDEKNEIMTHMITYYFYKINDGKTEYLKNVFQLYKLKLKLGIYDELKEIRYPSSAFRDYIVVGTRLKQYKWVENFIKKYSNKLPLDIKEEETNMAYARLYFGKKEFSKSLDMSDRINSNNPLYYLDASRNKLRIFYETLKFEEAFFEIDRIKHYINNNFKKIALPVRKYSKEFLESYNKLLKFRLNPDKIEIDFFLKNISESETLITKNWFIEKTKELL